MIAVSSPTFVDPVLWRRSPGVDMIDVTAAMLGVAAPNLVDRLFAGSRPDEAMIEGVRRARDALPPPRGKTRATSGIWGFGVGSSTGKDAGSGWGPARLAEGVGIDARRYVEGLLSLNR